MIRAVLFDVDGTLYHQPPLRLLMAGELGTASWVRHAPWNVPRLWRMLSVFRDVREELRALGRSDEPLARLQYTKAAERAEVPVDDMEGAVEEWIYRRPLKYLPRVVRSGMADVLSALNARGLRVGAFSDYPVAEKLHAMGLRSMMSLEVDATCEAVNAFKPHPRGLEVACQQWGVSPGDVLYVGDRAEVDARGAAALEMPCAIVGSRTEGNSPWPHRHLRHMRDLLALVEGYEDVH
jgi:phosphoglycolate phosphatase/putative hydrolase of the HAD superfamily